jgi:phenylpropionate dioxygenase-like ring-hydroxylating dioxygenase large terminal subunit
MSDAADDALHTLDEYLREDMPPRSLPPTLYTSPEVYALERERIIASSWFSVARSDDLSGAGSYICVSIGDEAVVVARRADGTLSAMSPICRHRLMNVVGVGAGQTDRFTCPYHLWKYDLDGRLLGAPFMNDSAAFEQSELSLPSMSVTEWHGIVFVNLDPNADPSSFATKLAPVNDALESHQLDTLVEVARYDTEWSANWKTAVENASESYHHMGLHAKTVEPALPSRGTHIHRGSPWWAYHQTPLATPTPSSLPTLSTDDLAEAKMFTIFPSTVIVANGELCNWQTWLPAGPDRVRVIGTFLLPPSSLPTATTARDATVARMQSALRTINEEDRAACESIHVAAASRSAARGPLSSKELGLLDFYRFLALTLSGSSGRD